MVALRLFSSTFLALLCLPLLSAASDEGAREIPISIDITTQLDFSRAAITEKSGGTILLDAQSGTRRVDGGLVDLGGFGLAGTAIVRGEPGRAVRIDMPPGIKMTSSTGGQIDITGICNTLSAAPRLDAFGQLSFAFGGNVEVKGNISGTFRGRIPITAEYE
jgi:Domain of unknown function (DUF4402)